MTAGMNLTEQPRALVNDAQNELSTAIDAEALDAWWMRYLSRKGALQVLLHDLVTLPPSELPAVGREAYRVTWLLERLYQDHGGLR